MTLEVAPVVELVVVITLASVASLGLETGRDAYAVIKASSVMVAQTANTDGHRGEMGST